MRVRLVFTIENKELEEKIAQSFSHADVQVECYGQTKSPWKKTVQSCGDIIVISFPLIPQPVDSSLTLLNSLPENPTTVVLHDSDSPEEHAKLLAVGTDTVLYSGILFSSLGDAIEATLESRRQLIQLGFERRTREQPKLNDFHSTSEVMQLFLYEVQQVAPSNSILLLLGETGVGKEHLAKAIHAESPRANGPFVALNTAALPEQLLESELFGHARGAFTGATRSRRGAFEMAHGGTIFLDEIGEMPLHLQAKLLRVLQEFEVQPLGGEKSIWVDTRVIAATNRDLEEAVEKGTFRKDLYYRLSVMSLTIPPLRERREDIPALARRFITYFRYKIGRDINVISEPAMMALSGYDWPGNVRELMNVIERGILICRSNEISLQDLPSAFHKGGSIEGSLLPGSNGSLFPWKGKTLPQVQREVLDQVERLYIEMVLTETRGRVARAARLADVHPRNMYNKMKRLGMRKEDFRKK